jgi:hypothetical protein
LSAAAATFKKASNEISVCFVGWRREYDKPGDTTNIEEGFLVVAVVLVDEQK